MGETQTKLLDLGEAFMRRRGYDGFSYADISREAGIRKASIHYHFPTKSDLALAVLKRYGKRLVGEFDTISRTSRNGGQALLKVIDLYRPTEGSGDALCLCVAMGSDTHAINHELRELLDQSNKDVMSAIEAMLAIGRRDRSISVSGDPAMEAKAILAQLHGAQLLARTARDPQTFDQAVLTLTARISRH
jgi:TetR/AcrR family transcriptional repressor of nem operon